MKGFIYVLPYVCMVVIFMFFLISRDNRIAAISGPIFIIGFIIYYLISTYDAFIIWKRDREDGDQEAILEYIETYSSMPSGSSKGTISPGCISASFRIHSMFSDDKYCMEGEIISLSGDVKNYDFIKGNKYKVTMRIHSKKIINIVTLQE